MRILKWIRQRIERMAMKYDPPCPYGCRTELQFIHSWEFRSYCWAMQCSKCKARTPSANTKRRALAKARKWAGGKW